MQTLTVARSDISTPLVPLATLRPGAAPAAVNVIEWNMLEVLRLGFLWADCPAVFYRRILSWRAPRREHACKRLYFFRFAECAAATERLAGLSGSAGMTVATMRLIQRSSIGRAMMKTR